MGTTPHGRGVFLCLEPARELRAISRRCGVGAARQAQSWLPDADDGAGNARLRCSGTCACNQFGGGAAARELNLQDIARSAERQTAF